MNRKKTTAVKSKEKKGKQKPSYFAQASKIVKDDRTRKIFGSILLMISVYLTIACVSYIFHGQHDQLLLENQYNPNAPFRNAMGQLGAITAYWLMNQNFGIAALLIPIFLFLLGFRMLFRKHLLPMAKYVRHAVFGLIYLPLLMGFFGHEKVTGIDETIQLTVNENIVGGYGLWITKTCIYNLGWFGTFLIVLVCAAAYIIINFNDKLKILGELSASLKLPDFGFGKNKTPDTPEPASNAPMNSREMAEMELESDLDTDSADDVLDALSGEDEQTIIQEIVEDDSNDTFETDDLEIEPIITEPEIASQPSTAGPEIEIEAVEKEEELSEDEIDGKVQEFGEYDPKLDLSRYELPNIDLLESYGTGALSINKDELEVNKNKIVETLNNYKIEISKIKATIGPTVTLYEIIPAPGVRISKIKNLEDDIALSLAALGIRIIAPIPGKGTIGIEVPNSNPDIVSMRSLIASDKFQNNNMELPVALGKTISNETFIADLAKMPHLLMAGATGQGKSVGLNAILVSLLYKKHPSQIKFVLVDPKKVELTLFNKIERHFLAKLPDEEEAIITDTSKVVTTLNSLCVEMDDRYELLKKGLCRNLKEYNAKFIKRKLNPENGHRYLPYIVLVVDEFADLIMTAGKEVETPIARLAQLARAIGIHLIIATQRPSVNIITGTIKANFPSRIAFRVTSKIDSRTILDAGGADQLIGRGDMLYSTGSELIRLQCGFVDTPEVEKITEFIGSQQGYPSAFLLPEYVDDNASEIGNLADEDRDELFEDAARIIVLHQQGSASLLQRKLKLGYNRAGRLIDQLESAGIIGPFKGSKAREVIIPDELSLEQLLNSGSNNNEQI